jgi:hypothetical protein
MTADQKHIKIKYRPREQFRPFHSRKQRWSVLVCHRRAGKTVATLNDLIRGAVNECKPEGRYAFIFPQRNQAKQHYCADRIGRPAARDGRRSIPAGIRVFLRGRNQPAMKCTLIPCRASGGNVCAFTAVTCSGRHPCRYLQVPGMKRSLTRWHGGRRLLRRTSRLATSRTGITPLH